MATQSAISLKDPGIAAAARAAGYTSKRLGPALWVLEILTKCGGDEERAEAIVIDEARAALAAEALS